MAMKELSFEFIEEFDEKFREAVSLAKVTYHACLGPGGIPLNEADIIEALGFLDDKITGLKNLWDLGLLNISGPIKQIDGKL
jgi:hypothetical protein